MWAGNYSAGAPPACRGDAQRISMNHQRELSRFLQGYRGCHPSHQCAIAAKKKTTSSVWFILLIRPLLSIATIADIDDAVCYLETPAIQHYPTYIGQEANMAIEDALAFGASSHRTNFQVEKAFQEYYAKQFNRTKRMGNMTRYMILCYYSTNPIVHSKRQRLLPWFIELEHDDQNG